MLLEKRFAMTEVPGHRSNVRGFYESGAKKVGIVGGLSIAVVFTSNSA